MTFREWWRKNSNYEMEIYKDVYQNAYDTGRINGIDSVNALPHRIMFDEGYEFGFKEGMDKVIEIANNFMDDITKIHFANAIRDKADTIKGDTQ